MKATPPLRFMSEIRSACSVETLPTTGLLHSMPTNRPRLSYPSKSRVPLFAVFTCLAPKHPVFILWICSPVALSTSLTSATTAASERSIQQPRCQESKEKGKCNNPFPLCFRWLPFCFAVGPADLLHNPSHFSHLI